MKRDNIIIVVTIVVVVMFIMIAFSNTSSNNVNAVSSNAGNKHINTGINSAFLWYKYASDNNTYFISSKVIFTGTGNAEILNIWFKPHSFIPVWRSSINVSMNSLLFKSERNYNHSLSFSGMNVSMNRDVQVNGKGLVSFASTFLTILNGSSQNSLYVKLLYAKTNVNTKLSFQPPINRGYFFIPQLISPSHILTPSTTTRSLSTNSTEKSITNNTDPSLTLQEKDNTMPFPFGHYNVWYVKVSLSISSFNPVIGQFSVSGGAQSPNWWKVRVTNSECNGYPQSFIKGFGNGVFDGVFPLGQYDYWIGYGNVTISDSNGAYSGYISDVIVSITSTGSIVLWSNTQVSVNTLGGSQTITEFIA